MVDPRETRFEGIHCNLVIQHYPGVLVLSIQGTDIGEFGAAPLNAIRDLLSAEQPVDLFIDARNVNGASIEVSGDWAALLSTQRAQLRSVTMLTGSRFIQVTAEFVRRFASLEGMMRICTESRVFDQELAGALKRA